MAASNAQPTGAAIDLYCSFEAQPPPNITWYYVNYYHHHHQQQQSFHANSRSYPGGDDDNQGEMIDNSGRQREQSSQPLLLAFNNNNTGGGGGGNNGLNRKLLTARHLRIVEPSLADIGTYVCVANNSHFEVKHETDLLLRSLLQVNLTVAGPQNALSPVTFMPGDFVTLTCNLSHLLDGAIIDQVLSSRFLITYHWYRDLVPIGDNGGGGGGGSGGGVRYHDRKLDSLYEATSYIERLHKNVLRIRNIRYNDEGAYQCFVRLTGPDYEEWLSAAAIVRLERRSPYFLTSDQAAFRAHTLARNEKLSLKCSANGIPTPMIVWRRNGVNLTDLSGNLVVGGSDRYRYNVDYYPEKSSEHSLSHGESVIVSHLNITQVEPQVSV